MKCQKENLGSSETPPFWGIGRFLQIDQPFVPDDAMTITVMAWPIIEPSTNVKRYESLSSGLQTMRRYETRGVTEMADQTPWTKDPARGRCGALQEE